RRRDIQGLAELGKIAQGRPPSPNFPRFPESGLDHLSKFCYTPSVAFDGGGGVPLPLRVGAPPGSGLRPFQTACHLPRPPGLASWNSNEDRLCRGRKLPPFAQPAPSDSAGL